MRTRKRKESHWRDGQASGYDWCGRTLRIAVYMRDGWSCLACGYHASPDHPGDGAHPWAGLTLDHLRRDCPKPNDPTNLVTLCLSCNSSRRAVGPAAWDATFAETAYFQVRKALDRKAALELAKAIWPKRYAAQAARCKRWREKKAKAA